MLISMNFSIDIDLESRLVTEKINGTWNAEIAREYHDEFMKTVAPLTGGEWAKMIDLHNWKSSYPEVVDIVGDHLIWCRKNGMVLSVNILDNPVTIGQLKRMFVRAGTAEISRLVPNPDMARAHPDRAGFHKSTAAVGRL